MIVLSTEAEEVYVYTKQRAQNGLDTRLINLKRKFRTVDVMCVVRELEREGLIVTKGARGRRIDLTEVTYETLSR